MRQPPILVTYVSHYGKNGLPFRCCAECTDTYDFLDWLKEREYQVKKPTEIIAWHYVTSLQYLPGREKL